MKKIITSAFALVVYSLLLAYFFPIFSSLLMISALVKGVIEFREIRKNNGKGKAGAIIAISFGSLYLIMVIFIMIVYLAS